MEPELEALLSAIHAERPDNDELVVGMPDHNLARSLGVIIGRAGMEPWPKPCHTLRKWRETTWMARFPAPFVAQWMGNSVQVAMDHYTAVPEEYFSAGVRLTTNHHPVTLRQGGHYGATPKQESRQLLGEVRPRDVPAVHEDRQADEHAQDERGSRGVEVAGQDDRRRTRACDAG
jgi:hypothetical protein